MRIGRQGFKRVEDMSLVAEASARRRRRGIIRSSSCPFELVSILYADEPVRKGVGRGCAMQRKAIESMTRSSAEGVESFPSVADRGTWPGMASDALFGTFEDDGGNRGPVLPPDRASEQLTTTPPSTELKGFVDTEQQTGNWFETQLALSVAIGLASFITFCVARPRSRLLFSPRTLFKGTPASIESR